MLISGDWCIRLREKNCEKFYYLSVKIIFKFVICNFLVGIGAALCKALVEAGMIVCGMSKRKGKIFTYKLYSLFN